MAKQAKKKPQRRQPANQHIIFVSHATADKWIAKRICEAIETTGAATFRDDRDIEGGDSIPDSIRAQLLQATELLVLLTPNSVSRPWVLLEIGAFWGRKGSSRIVPVLYLVDVSNIPEHIASIKAVHLNDLDSFVQELKKRVGKVLQ
jgi:hypothetical protein